MRKLPRIVPRVVQKTQRHRKQKKKRKRYWGTWRVDEKPNVSLTEDQGRWKSKQRQAQVYQVMARIAELTKENQTTFKEANNLHSALLCCYRMPKTKGSYWKRPERIGQITCLEQRSVTAQRQQWKTGMIALKLRKNTVHLEFYVRK